MSINRVTIHCSVTPNGKDIDWREIDKWHRARRFRKIGYHYLLQPSGHVDSYASTNGGMRALNEAGAHVKNYNKDSFGNINVGICMIGNDKFTTNQFYKLRETIVSLRQSYNFNKYDVWCHYEFYRLQSKKPKKSCPNMRIGQLLLFLENNDISMVSEYIHKPKL